MGRVFVTGDTHGSNDILKLTGKYWPEGRTLTRDDLLVICGDFGLVWSDPASEESAFWLDWVEARPWTTLFVDGNHENHDLLDSYEVVTWNGGRAHEIPEHPHVLHLMRGQTYEIPGHGTWFVMGGARSQDKEWRVEGESWWSKEMPSDEEYAAATQALERIDFAPDYVFTHDCPSDRLTYAMPWYVGHFGVMPPSDALNTYLQFVDERLDTRRLKGWYCGHYHRDAGLGDEVHHLLYQQVVELGAAPRTDAGEDEFVPGVGIAIPDKSLPLEEVVRREHATLDELREFIGGQAVDVSPQGEPLVFAGDQEAFRRRVNAQRKRALCVAGPHADIL